MALQTLHQADHNVVGVVDGRLIVFGRTGRLTSAALDVIEAEASRAIASGVRPTALLAVVPGDAGMSGSDLLERQRKMMKSFAVDDQTLFGMVVLGTSVQSVMMRAFLRVSFLGRPSMTMTDDVHSASVWLSARMKMPVAEIEDAVRALQAKM